jgi:DNA helicase-2/ATP-dependent DNA helicase PcrA
VQLQTLTALLDFIKEETKRNPFLTLQELADLFELMRKEGFAMPLKFINATENGVDLLTPQDCKGLEYEYIFIAGVNAQNWEKKKKSFVGYSFPDTMFISNCKNNVDEQSRRSFYVALSRGQKQLHISYSRFKDDRCFV